MHRTWRRNSSVSPRHLLQPNRKNQIMFSILFDFILYEPRRIVKLGKALCSTGSFLIIAGLIGRAASVGIAAIESLGGRHDVERSLADIYPTLLTWWVPETALGYAVGAALMLLGITVTKSGMRLHHLLA